VTKAKGSDMIFERPLMFEVGATNAEPAFAAVFLVGSPVTFHGQRLGALAAREGLGAMLPLEVRLKRAKVLERLRTWVVDVVLAPSRATVAGNVQQGSWMGSLQRVWSSAIL